MHEIPDTRLANIAGRMDGRKTTIQSAITPVLIYAVLSMGCGTGYSPREPGRLNFVLSSGGGEVLEKDGKRYRVQGFSGDLVEAVAGNPAAEEHARTYVHRQRVAGGLSIAAATALVIGFFCFGILVGPSDFASGDGDPSGRRGLQIAMGSSFLIGVASAIGAAMESRSAEGHLYDAVNVYNDDVARRQTR